MKNQCVYLDDVRIPPNDKKWMVLRSSKEAIDFVKNHGCPEYWSFDHDLGEDDTTMVFLKWLIDFDIENGGSIIPKNFKWDIHSSNPPGRENIHGFLTSYTNHRNNNG